MCLIAGWPLAIFWYPRLREQVELAPIKSRVHKEIVQQFDMNKDFTRAQASDIMDALNFIEQE